MTKPGTKTTMYSNSASFLVPGVDQELGAPQEALHGPREIPGVQGRTRQSLWDPSPGHVFLLQAMEQISSTRSARPPSVPLLRRSSRMRWLSEPPAERGVGGGCGIGVNIAPTGDFSKKGLGLRQGLPLLLGAEEWLPWEGPCTEVSPIPPLRPVLTRDDVVAQLHQRR